MARITVKKAQLLGYHYELQQMIQDDSIMIHFVGGRIEQFYKNNEAKLNAVVEKQNNIREKYIQKTENGKQWKLTDKGEPIFILPVIELNEADLAAFQKKQKEDFEKESKELLNEGVDIIV